MALLGDVQASIPIKTGEPARQDFLFRSMRISVPKDRDPAGFFLKMDLKKETGHSGWSKGDSHGFAVGMRHEAAELSDTFWGPPCLTLSAAYRSFNTNSSYQARLAAASLAAASH